METLTLTDWFEDFLTECNDRVWYLARIAYTQNLATAKVLMSAGRQLDQVAGNAW